MQKSRYVFQDNRLIIQDQELGIDIDEPFAPLMLPSEAKHGELLNDNTLVLVRQLEQAMECKGVRTGQYKLLYPDGKLKFVCYYLEGKLHGPSIFYSLEGVETARSWFYKGKRQGVCVWNYHSGALYSRQRFVEGVWEGAQEYYYPDGARKTLLFFKKGILTGKAKAWKRDGSLERELDL